MYTIFKNDTSIILTDDVNVLLNKNHFLWKEVRQQNGLEKLLSLKQAKVYLIDKDLQTMWKEFKQYFKIIEASGGIVKNNNDQILFIFRKNWLHGLNIS